MRNFLRLASRLSGTRTLSEICKMLDIDRQTAVSYLSVLRKKGYVHKTKHTKPERTYVIKPYRKIRVKKGLVDVLNENLPSDFQIEEPYEHYIWGDYPIEKAIVDSLDSEKARFVLASLLLFKKVKNWGRLYKLSKSRRRKIGALYDLARREVPKIPRMDKRSYNALLKSPKESPYFFAKAKTSDEYQDISEKWGVYVPFTRADLRRLKG